MKTLKNLLAFGRICCLLVKRFLQNRKYTVRDHVLHGSVAKKEENKTDLCFLNSRFCLLTAQYWGKKLRKEVGSVASRVRSCSHCVESKHNSTIAQKIETLVFCLFVCLLHIETRRNADGMSMQHFLCQLRRCSSSEVPSWRWFWRGCRTGYWIKLQRTRI